MEKIRFYLDRPDERDRIAEAGFKRTAREHTYESRMQEILDEAVRSRQSQLKGMAGQRMVSMDEAVQAHQCPLPLKGLGELLAWLCSLIWGRERGPRAARRAVYELSWRIMGEKTFRASGWPGRMFPKE